MASDHKFVTRGRSLLPRMRPDKAMPGESALRRGFGPCHHFRLSKHGVGRGLLILEAWFDSKRRSQIHGELAHLGERLPCTQEVISSILIFSTN